MPSHQYCCNGEWSKDGGKGSGAAWAWAEIWHFEWAGKPAESFKKGENWVNTWFCLCTSVLLCEICIKGGRGVYGLTRVAIVKMDRNRQIWDVLDLGQYISKFKDFWKFKDEAWVFLSEPVCKKVLAITEVRKRSGRVKWVEGQLESWILFWAHRSNEDHQAGSQVCTREEFGWEGEFESRWQVGGMWRHGTEWGYQNRKEVQNQAFGQS